MHEPEMVSSPGCGINSQGQRADPHGGNLIQESLLAILEKKKKGEHTCQEQTEQGHPGRECRKLGMEQPMLPSSGWEARSITKLEDTATSSLTSSSDGAVSAPPQVPLSHRETP